MIIFWGSKGYTKELGHTQTSIECDIVTMLNLGKLWKLVVNLPSTGFHSFLMVSLTMFHAQYANTDMKLRNLRLKSI